MIKEDLKKLVVLLASDNTPNLEAKRPIVAIYHLPRNYGGRLEIDLDEETWKVGNSNPKPIGTSAIIPIGSCGVVGVYDSKKIVHIQYMMDEQRERMRLAGPVIKL